jgi:hypothetical protein
MELFNQTFDPEYLFKQLFFAGTEQDIDDVLLKNKEIFQSNNWYPLGGDERMFGIVRGQQSNPIAALVEKVTNSIDAVLMKKCFEAGIDPQSKEAPKNMEEAIKRFFPDHKQWDLRTFRRRQSEEIQIVADGPPRNTSVIIYDNGEGQHPEEFENTFLSLVRGNKINIHFVQGKYNMGGSGALVFCGKNRYQLIGSKRFDNSGKFGFTLVRQNKIGDTDSAKRFSYFEYFKFKGLIPSFDSKEMDLKLFDRKFKTGSILKMYSYQFPPGYSGFAQDLNQSLNEFLFEPVLPILTVDKKERYPNNKVLELDLFGLKRRLEEDKNEYVDGSPISEEYDDQLFGKAKVTCYVFKPKLDGRDVKKTKEIIRDRFFRNDMSVMFSVNGQVHGSYSSEFITRALKFNLLKDYLLIHVDCTDMKADFREELFMSDRERLKKGDEANQLRDFLGKKLRKSQLDEINRRRRESIGLESEDTSELIKSFAKNLPKDSELFKLLQNTLKLEELRDKKKSEKNKKPSSKPEVAPFLSQRFPTFFKLHKKKEGINAVTIPINGEKTIKFDTDAENEFFDRIEEPGELQIALLKIKHNDRQGGDQPGTKKEISDILNIDKSSPNNGTIKITFNPTKEIQVGDELEVKVSLIGVGEPFDEILLIKISDPESKKEPVPKEESYENIGLPELIKVKENEWSKLQDQGIQMDYDTVMYPVGEGDKLDSIYINLDSHVYLRHRSKLKNENQILVAQKKYMASVYFHTLFLYMITKRRNYSLTYMKENKQEEITIDEYLRDVFDSYYSDFLLNFGTEQLMGMLEE